MHTLLYNHPQGLSAQAIASTINIVNQQHQTKQPELITPHLQAEIAAQRIVELENE